MTTDPCIPKIKRKTDPQNTDESAVRPHTRNLPQTQTIISKSRPAAKVPAPFKPSHSPCDTLLTSPSKIKQFVGSEPSSIGSTIFTQRKKKLLDGILLKERENREKVLQEYRNTLQKEEGEQIGEGEDQDENIPTQDEGTKFTCTFDEDPSSSTATNETKERRKRRKTDSPEPPRGFDLRQVLSKNKSAVSKPDCKRARQRSDASNPPDSSKSGRSGDSGKPATKPRDPQLDLKSKLFDPLAALSSRDISLPDRTVTGHSSLTVWLREWKEAEVKLKELRTKRLQIRDPDYEPRDLGRLRVTNIPEDQLAPRLPPKTQDPPKQATNISKSSGSRPKGTHFVDSSREAPETDFGWKSSKPDSEHVDLFPSEEGAGSVSTDAVNLPNLLLEKINPLLKKSKTQSSKKDNKIPGQYFISYVSYAYQFCNTIIRLSKNPLEKSFNK